jgi:hypothetical protein
MRTTGLALGWRHVVARVGAVLRSPADLIVLAGLCIATLVYGPEVAAPFATLSDRSASLGFDDGDVAALWMLWVYLWPALPMIVVAGRVSGRGMDAGIGHRGVPSLPVGPTVRTMAEVGLVCAALFGTWGVAALVDYAPFGGPVAWLTALILLVPMLVAWGTPARNLNLYMLRPLITALLLFVARVVGWLDKPLGAMAVAAAVTAVLLTTTAALDRVRLGDLFAGRAKITSRPGLEGATRLAMDLWNLPARFWGPWLGVTALLLAAVTVLDGLGQIGGWWFFIACELFVVVSLQVAFRPFNSVMIGNSMTGRCGVQSGDFLKAWARLPVAPITVLRYVWLHSVGVFVGTWLVVLAAVVLRTWLSTGQLGFADGDGDPIGQLLLPTVLLAPVIAAFMVAAAVGVRWAMAVSGVSLLLAVHSVLLVDVVARTLFIGHENLVGVFTVGYGLVLVLVGSLPGPWLLRQSRFTPRLAPQRGSTLRFDA